MKTYCFDFDGTIADTLPIIVRKADYLLKESGEEEIDGKTLRRLRENGVQEVFREMGIPLYKLFFLYLKIKKEINQEISQVAISQETREMLEELKKRDCVLGILTSNSKSTVEDFLEFNKLNLFDFIKSSGVLGKERSIKKIKRKGGKFIYIGDEVRDIRAGRKAKVKTIAVSWGLCSRKALLRERPDALIERPCEILDLSF